ncbi:MAG: hypothetical protein DRP15_03535 [Candidatus Aenigmatarchaeota archaeon]|nr:MAG: hypothetical protein DRP15_03535 [Candidatus Aenigmarchaeota archaeon]
MYPKLLDIPRTVIDQLYDFTIKEPWFGKSVVFYLIGVAEECLYRDIKDVEVIGDMSLKILEPDPYLEIVLDVSEEYDNGWEECNAYPEFMGLLRRNDEFDIYYKSKEWSRDILDSESFRNYISKISKEKMQELISYMPLSIFKVVFSEKLRNGKGSNIYIETMSELAYILADRWQMLFDNIYFCKEIM